MTIDSNGSGDSADASGTSSKGLNSDSKSVEGQAKPSKGLGVLASLMGRIKILVCVELVIGLIVLPIAYLAGADLELAAIAWAVCFVGTILAHLASEFPKGNEFVMLRLASGMACRTLLPLGFAIWGFKFREPRVEASIILVLVLAYLAGLAADSYMSLVRLKSEMPNQS